MAPTEPGRVEQFFAERKLSDAKKAEALVDNLPQIKHVVVLMMENHSFDNYLGMLGPDKGGYPDIGPDGVPVASNPAEDGTPIALWHKTTTGQLHHRPTQSWRASHIQWNHGAMDGFVRTSQEMSDDPAKDTEGRDIPMAYWTEAELPFYYSLARTFPLATRWFAPCMGPTFPNRRFLLAGTAHGLMDNVFVGMLDTPKNGTILDVLSAKGVTWCNYHNVPSSKLFLTRLLGTPGIRLGRWLRLLGSGPVGNYVVGNMQFTANLFPTGLLRVWKRTAPIKKFFEDAAAGTLPFFSLVDPDFTKWSEENKQDIQNGEGFAAKVINAVMDGPGWKNTVLVWCYDEHGGYYDHVEPPETVAPDERPARSLLDLPKPVTWVLAAILRKDWKRLQKADGIDDRAYTRYGMRVPAVVVSPYAKRDCVTDTVFDHTSILKLIEDKWGLEPLTARDAAAHSLLEVLDFDNPGFAQPPVLAKPAKEWSLSAAG